MPANSFEDFARSFTRQMAKKGVEVLDASRNLLKQVLRRSVVARSAARMEGRWTSTGLLEMPTQKLQLLRMKTDDQKWSSVFAWVREELIARNHDTLWDEEFNVSHRAREMTLVWDQTWDFTRPRKR
jgi:hypothetical protein